MAVPILMPKFGQMTEHSVIIEWRKPEGAAVAKGDLLFTVETDKSVMEVESFEEGTLLKIVVPAGVSVPVQSTVGFLGQPGEAVPDVAPASPVAGTAPAGQPVSTPESGGPAGPPPAVSTAAPAPPPAPPTRPPVSPRARALARECGIDPTGAKGSGPGGRIVEADVTAYLAQQGYERLRVSPAARKLAASAGLDLLKVRGTGEAGRVTVADVQRAVAEKPRPLSRMRQVIAERLTRSVQTAPHFFVTVQVDMTDLVQWRTERKETGQSFTITDFIAQAVVLALMEHPVLNSSTDGRSVRWHSQVHLGLAVSLDDGLVVPVIRAADELTLAELSARAKGLVAKARAGQLAPDEMSGSTFTVSNLGMLDVENFTAIINPGEAAILAVARVLDQPAVRAGRVVVRSLMKITLSADHRLVDGARAARFLQTVKSKLEDLELWKRLTS